MQAQAKSRGTGFRRNRAWWTVVPLMAWMAAPAGLALAQGAGQPPAVAESEVMQGFPPPPDRQVSRGTGLRPPYMRWAFRHAREMSPTAGIRHASQPLALPGQSAPELDAVRFSVAGQTVQVADYLRDTHTDGFIVLHQGRIVYERYLAGFGPHQPHIWASMTKSVTGLLAAMLVEEGKLDPQARLAQYVPELAGNPFGEATVQQNLDMEVPVGYPQALPPDLGLFGAVGIVPRKADAPDTIYDFLKVVHATGTAGEGPDGGVWYYQNGSPEAVAWALRRITGKRWADLVTERLWSRFADDDAYTQIDRQGTEMASGGMNSTLRDAARFAETVRRAAAGDATLGISPQAVRIALQPASNQARFARGNTTAGRDGYGYRNYWFQRNDGDGSIEASGRFGQKLYINPARGLTVVKFSASPDGAARATSAAGVRKRDDPAARVLESSEAMVAAAHAIVGAASR
ncbi:6-AMINOHEXANOATE-DIMER HYDROLASE, Beta-lactamase family [Cupriavidus taiwanensis]|uniref:6-AMINOHEXANOATE-DIMER HYDROLASE, Beta-lactamase family n=1 Tax=Cupriavidus taiwanensis TaxID=164546 RepID=A0A976B3M7_9BURK|nr:serine hydrolase [Cupriavidus taiwanensis]SOZ62821.1 6-AMINOHEXANOATE-DIMER HYDROLASE, Beta-lactamase family [Cupriavidus taiwanensis]SOZ63202.1 6-AMINOHEXANOATE-DIMER HYDROLASE, Beta-lactamase family [Cupriavidus taiwanensis]SOZ74178.1 6-AMINOHEXANOATE-DIMER HYDROLASE, Beta-lactamase family [Cupriavidus taiwanensis]SPA11080.1 6-AMINOHEXANOATE-DIMER HYDROLASE, Beta-lactamase family [Cupriavidus taiwanensis]